MVPIMALGPALTMPIEEYAIDTAAFHIYRTVVFSEARQDGGGLLPRWTQPTNGNLGGPLFAYTPGLMYYLMDGFHALGVDFAHTWRATTALMLIAASVGMTGLGLALFRRADAALVSAAAFVYAPLLLRDFFGRGSPQAVGVALFPWVLWALIVFTRQPNGRHFAGLALSWGQLLFAHNLSALLLAPVIGLILLLSLVYPRWHGPRAAELPFRRWMGRHIGGAVLALAAGSLLAAFYVFPIAAELEHIQIDNPQATPHAYPADNPTTLVDLMALPPVMDTGIENDEMGDAVGLLHVFGLVVGAGLAAWGWQRRRYPDALLLAGLVALCAVLIWLQTSAATPVWENIPALDVLQFRFRLLSAVSLTAALAWGYLVSMVPPRLAQWRGPLAGVLLIALAGMQVPTLYPELMHRQNRFADHLTSADVVARTTAANTASLASFNEFVPVWRHMPFSAEEAQRAAESPLTDLPEGATLTQATRTTRRWTLHIDTPIAFTAAFHLLYYPGWEAHIDGEQHAVRPATDNTGYLLLDIPAGEHTVTLHYTGTTAQRLGDWATLLTALALAGLALLWRPDAARSEPGPAVYLEPNARLLAAVGLVLLAAGVKTWWIDPQTNLFRHTSTCASIHGVDHYPAVTFSAPHAGDRYMLCGYHLPDSTLQAGDTLRVTVYWQTPTTPDTLAASFAHLVGDRFNPRTNNPIWGQQDKQLPGGHLTTTWRPDMLYRDTFAFTIPAHTPPGTYQLEIGWYTRDDGTRLPPTITAPEAGVSISDWDSLLLAPITIR